MKARLAALVIAAAGILALAGCKQRPVDEEVAVDTCLLKQYINECPSDEVGTPQEIADCERQAPLSATRLLAGIPQACRPHD